MKKILLSLALLCAAVCQAQIGTIITVAGNGTAGYAGDGGLAGLARINAPHGLAVDSLGNYYIDDQGNNRIRKIDLSGVITTVAGNGIAGYVGDGGAATNAEINTPYKASIDNFGNIIIADNVNARIRKVSPTGVISTIAGNGVVGYGGDGGPAIYASFDNICTIAFDRSNNIYIADDINNRIRVIDAATGIITTFAGTGAIGFSGDGGPASLAKLYIPAYLYFDSAQNLFFSDNGNHAIRRIDARTGFITTVAGTGVGGYNGDGIAATAAQLYYPGGITMDKLGNLYIADYYNSRVRLVNTSGIITTLAGTGAIGYSGDGGPASVAKLYHAVDVVFDNAGNLLIADFGNQRIREVKLCYPPSIAAISGSSTVCAGSNILLTDTTSGILWSISNAHATISSGMVTGVTGGIDTVMLTATNSCGTSRSYQVITVFPRPDAGTISGLDSVCIDSVITLTDSITGGTWSSTNVGIANVFSGSVIGLALGVDTIKYTASNSCGSVFASRVVYVKNCTTGLDNVSIPADDIILFPNPTENDFTIHCKIPINKVEIFNLIGQKLFSRLYDSKIININLSQFPSGMYFVKINDCNIYKISKQ